MRTGIFLEYLGEIPADLIWENLVNANESKPSIEDFRVAFPRGFVVSAQIEQQIHETPEENKSMAESLPGRMRRASGFEVPGRRLIGLLMIPK